MTTFRSKFYSRTASVQEMAPGKYRVEHDAGVFTVEGGKKLGGAANEWFLEGPHTGGTIACTSVADALRLLETI